MANSNHASYSKIGFTIFIGILAIVALLIYLGGISDDRNFVFTETYCVKSVSGLSVGSPVNFRGVKLGQVREISFVGIDYDNVPIEDASKIRVVMAIRRKLVGFDKDDREMEQMMRRYAEHGLRATVTASGITGLSRIELDIDPETNAVDRLNWTPKYVYIPSKVSLLDSFSDSATKVMNHINKMDINTAWSNVNASVSALARATEGVKVMINSNQPEIERVIEDLAEASAALRETSSEIRRNPSLLIRERRLEPISETE